MEKVISQEDANLKLLRSLPSAWKNIALIMRNKFVLDTMSMDDLYNNLKVYKVAIKGQSSSSSNSQNVAFVSSKNTSNTNEAVNTDSMKFLNCLVHKDKLLPPTYVDDVMFSFFVNQSNSPHLDNKELKQIDTDDLEEMDLKWHVAMLTIRVKRFLKKTGRNLNFNGKETVGFDKTKGSSNSSSSNTKLEEALKEKDDLKLKLEKFETSSMKLTKLINNQISVNNKSGVGFDSQMNENELHDCHLNKSEVFESASDSSVNEIKEENNQVNDRFKKMIRHKTNKMSETISSVPRIESTASKSSKDSLEQPKDVRPSAPIIEEWESDSDDDCVIRPSFEQNKPIVATKSGLMPVNAAKQSSPRAAASISTARHISTVSIKPKVYTAKVNNVTIAGPEIVVSTAERKRENAVESSACWIWRPTGKVIDHISKDSGSYMPKRFDYVDPQGRLKHMTRNMSYLTDYQDIDGGFVAFAGSPKGGIKREFSVARTPQQNGVVERKNWTLIEAARTMLADSLLLTTFWAEGGGPKWLFDIDSRTKSMNYEPITAGNQTNGDAVLRSTNKKDADEVPGKGDDDLSERNDQERIDSSTQDVNTVRPSINTASENINTRSSNINTASPIPNDPKADLNNLETTMNVSSIPTTRIHKDHPIKQIIGDLHSALLTRRTSQQNLKELALVSYIKKQRRTNHKDYQNCLFTCFLSQTEPKKVIQALTDTSWIEAIQEELLQFKLQKVWTLVNLPKGKRAIRTKIEAIRLFLAYASFMGLIVYQMDVKSTFLYGTIEEEEDGIYISQDKYVADILKKFDFVTVKTASTPMEPNKALVKDEEADIWMFQVTPKVLHLHAVKRIFRYLKGQPKLGLWYPRDSPFDLEAFSDSDYAGASLDRKSTTGGCQFLRKRLISWQCKKQTIIANSTTKAEYVAAINCCGEVLWIQNQMLDYGFNFMNTKIYIDNESTICIVKNPKFHAKTKHIEIRHHFIRDSYEKRLIQVIKAKHIEYLVGNDDVHKELGDRMERAAIIASSLEAEQDSGNINMTQSMATLNELSP
ncbi:putative reverse transcriptase, RNA-dependent DNA polymerase [Tanacetum coccineum]